MNLFKMVGGFWFIVISLIITKPTTKHQPKTNINE